MFLCLCHTVHRVVQCVPKTPLDPTVTVYQVTNMLTRCLCWSATTCSHSTEWHRVVENVCRTCREWFWERHTRSNRNVSWCPTEHSPFTRSNFSLGHNCTTASRSPAWSRDLGAAGLASLRLGTFDLLLETSPPGGRLRPPLHYAATPPSPHHPGDMKRAQPSHLNVTHCGSSLAVTNLNTATRQRRELG